MEEMFLAAVVGQLFRKEKGHKCNKRNKACMGYNIRYGKQD